MFPCSANLLYRSLFEFLLPAAMINIEHRDYSLLVGTTSSHAHSCVILCFYSFFETINLHVFILFVEDGSLP